MIWSGSFIFMKAWYATNWFLLLWNSHAAMTLRQTASVQSFDLEGGRDIISWEGRYVPETHPRSDRLDEVCVAYIRDQLQGVEENVQCTAPSFLNHGERYTLDAVDRDEFEKFLEALTVRCLYACQCCYKLSWIGSKVKKSCSNQMDASSSTSLPLFQF